MNPGNRWAHRVDATRWDTVRGDLDAYGCALTGPLLTRARPPGWRRCTRTTPGSGPRSTWAGTAA